jgi:3-oxoadipate enol-lactonase
LAFHYQKYAMAQYADDTANLLNVLNIERVDVIGVSFGGMVAQHFALRHASRVNKLVLCCTSPGGDMPSYPFHELPDDITLQERVVRLMAVSDVRRDQVWQAENPKEVEQILTYTANHAIVEHATDEFKRGARLQLLARAEHNVVEALPELRMPVLICAGKYDGIAPPENQHALHQLLPNSELAWFEGGHLFMIQDKAAWGTIIEFLSV